MPRVLDSFLEPCANLRLASVDHVIERLIMTVIETCSVGAVVCVSKNQCTGYNPKTRPSKSKDTN